MMKNLLNSILAISLFLMPKLHFGQAPDLGTTSTFALFTAVGAFSNDGATMVTGDIGTHVGAFSGFPPGTVVGGIHVANPVSAQAAADIDVAYMSMSTITCDFVIGTTMGSGQMLAPAVYCLGAASTINGDLILDGGGDPNALFIFKIDGALATTANSRVILIGLASICNVYWQVNGQVDLGVNSEFRGTLLVNGAINLLEAASLDGRALSRSGAISMHNNMVNLPPVPTASTITANGSTSLCLGESLILSGNLSNGTWSTGDTTETITVTIAGDYYLTDSNDCGSVESNHILVTVSPPPVPSVITASGSTIICVDESVILSGNVGGTWSTGAITPTITVTTSGDYFVTNTSVCGSVESNHIMVTIISPAPRPVPPAERDTIDCIGSLIHTVPGCRYVVNCYDTITGTVVDYAFIPGDCLDSITLVTRTVEFVYQHDIFFCTDTIAVRSLPDTLICPPERDSVYCHTGYLTDENGNPSPLETGVPLADSIPLWPQPPSVCDILIVYRDTEFGGDCPSTIKREWFINNVCTGSTDTCTQWIMIFDTIGPYITKIDTAAFFLPIVSASSHDCYAEFYVPSVTFEDTCSGVKQVKAIIYNTGTAILSYNPVTKCYESHQKFRIPVSEIDFIDGIGNVSYIRYEAIDSCHNQTILDSLPIFVVDRVKPVAVCDKGVNVTVNDSIVWVHASSFDEGSWDNCGIAMILARRSDWATACGVDLCDDIHYLASGEHHDSLWCARMETDKNINPVEAHYQKTIEWLCLDGQPCALPVLMGWFYDLLKYATIDCIDHPYEINEAYIDAILSDNFEELDLLLQAVLPCVKTVDADSFEEAFIAYFTNNPSGDILFEGLLRDYFNILFGGAYLNERAIADIGKQIGGGWSDAVPFCCEDACQDVTVELLVMDYWCNWSKCWTTVRVEDKTPPQVVCELYDATITCSAYKKYYAAAVELALQGDFDSLQSVLGGYDKVTKDSYGKVPAKTSYTIYDLTCDSNLVERDTLVYDEHLGYIWKTYYYYRAEYDIETYQRFNGQVADNCGLQCIEETPWISLDECGNGFIKRVFKFVGQCSDEPSGHFADTITRYQTIWITSDCEISQAMFEVPNDTIVYSCGIEYDTDGSGNVAGVVSPEFTGEAQYVFDYDCRLVGIGYYDKVFKIVGGDEACYKILRTWCFADWCGLGAPIEKAWWFNPRYEGRFLTYTQKIIVYDSQPPICTIAEIPADIDAAGCYYNLNTVVVVEDECGVLDFGWTVINTKTNLAVASGHGQVNSSQVAAFPITVNDLGFGSYKLKVTVRDECQNESVCDAEFNINANKKPTPICITSLTTDLTPMDSDGDGLIDTAWSVVWANEFDASSQPACGSLASELNFRIAPATGEVVLPPSSATSLYVGCADQGTQEVRLFVIDESGTWDYCTVLLIVQNNAQGCGDPSQSSGQLIGEILTESGTPIEQVQVMVEGNSGVPLWEARDIRGEYSIDVTMGVEAFVRPQKNTDPLNGVSTSDLIAIQKHILGKAPLDTWYKERAADANNDGKVSAIDLIEIRKLILGMIDQLPNSDSWRFYERESQKTFYHIDVMKETMRADFTGIKVGDVNGNTDPALKANRSNGAVTLSVDRYLNSDRIAFRALDDRTINGIQLTLEFDPSKLKITNVLSSESIGISNDNFNLIRQENGWITLSWNPGDGSELTWTAGQELFSLEVNSHSNVDLSEILTISSKITPAEVYDGSGIEYGLNLSFNESDLFSEFSLLQNRPNPWRTETIIGFTLGESSNTTLTVFDVNGRMVKELGGYTPKGYHEWSIDNRDIPASGVYYYKLETNDHTAVKKMILMD